MVSWWQLLLPSYVYAETSNTSASSESPAEVTNGIDEAVIPPVEDILIDDTTTPSTINATDLALTSDLSLVATTVASSSPEDGAQFMVQYSLDGDAWQLLGYVTTVTNDVRLEFPRSVLPTLDDISRVKIAITPLQQLDTVAPVYLDAVWLEVSYAPLGELGIHSISEIIPAIVPVDTLISDATSTDAIDTSSTTKTLTTFDFVAAVTSVHGIDDRYVLVELNINATTSELWLFDMSKKLIHRLGTGESEIGNIPPGIKEGMIFWLNKRGEKLYTYDLRTSGVLHEMLLVQNLPLNSEYRLTFPFTQWIVIWRGDRFYFYSQITGEVFQDENTVSAQLLFKYFLFTQTLSFDHIQAIGGTFISESEIPVQ